MYDIEMGSFLSSLSSIPPPLDDNDSNLMEMEPTLSSGPHTGDSDLVGRQYPLNPNGHFTTNLLTGFRRQLRTDANTQIHQEWVLEPLLTTGSANLGPNILDHKARVETIRNEVNRFRHES